MRMREEELALQADVSIETIRSFRDQGLLPVPSRDGDVDWYSAEHLEAIARIKDLQRRGFSPALSRRSLSGDLDPADELLAMAVVRGVSGEPGPLGAGESEPENFDLDSLADRVGVPAEILSALVDEGLLEPHLVAGQPRFTTGDLTTLRGGLALVEAGIPLDDLLALARHHHAVTKDVSVRAVDLFDLHVRRPLLAADIDEADRSERLVRAFEELMSAVTALVADHFRRTLLGIATERFESPRHTGTETSRGTAVLKGIE